MTTGSRFSSPRRQLSKLAMACLCALPGLLNAAVFDQADTDTSGRIWIKDVVLPGGKAVLEGQAFVPGQKVTLLRGQSVLNPQAPYQVDEKGEFQASLDIPANAAPGIHTLIVQTSEPAATALHSLKISPVVPVAGAELFQVASQKLVPGLYQVVFSPRNNALYVTSAVGRPPVKASRLLKLNPETLAIEAQADALPVSGREDGHVHAVYGVGIDEANGNIWTTNTRDDSVAVYRASDLKLVKQFENGVLPHGRDVVADAAQGKIFASGSGQIAVFDAKTLAPLSVIEPRSALRGESFSPASLALDAAKGKLYTVSMSTPEAAVIDTASGAVERIIALPGARSAIGVAVDPEGQRLYVTAQGSDNLLIVDLRDGKVLHDVKTGAGPLNVTFDAVNGLAYVANRGAGTITVVDGNGRIVANLDGGSYPNHLGTDGKGHVFVVNKSKGSDDPQGDHIRRLTPLQGAAPAARQ